MADQARDLSHEKDAENLAKIDLGRRRQQHVQHHAGHRPVQGADQQLRQGQPRPHHRQFPGTQLDRLAAQHSQQQVGYGQHQHQQPEQPAVGRQIGNGAQIQRIQHQHRAADGQNAQPQGQGGEHDDSGDIHRRQAPARIQPVAQRTGGQHRQADRIAERVAEQRGEPDLGPGQRPADVAQRQPVVTGNDQVAEDGAQEGGEQLRARQPSQRGHDIAIMVGSQHLLQNPQRGDEQ